MATIASTAAAPVASMGVTGENVMTARIRCREAVWMVGSFEVLDNDCPRPRPDGGRLYMRLCARREVANLLGNVSNSSRRTEESHTLFMNLVYFLPRRVI